jgi:hypothetical protein
VVLNERIENIDYLGWLLFAAGIAGLAVGALVILFANDGERPALRLARCSMGFIVAVVWIMAIADEVVNVLQVSSYLVYMFVCLFNPTTDLRVHFWPIGRDNWTYYFCHWQFAC